MTQKDLAQLAATISFHMAQADRALDAQNAGTWELARYGELAYKAAEFFADELGKAKWKTHDGLLMVEDYANLIMTHVADTNDLPPADRLEEYAKQSLHRFSKQGVKEWRPGEPQEFIKVDSKKIKLIRDLLTTAFEGGSNYWYTIDDQQPPPGTTMDDFREGGRMQTPGDYFHWSQLIPTIPGGHLIVMDKLADEGVDSKYRLDLEALDKGLRLFKQHYPKRYAEVIEENYDANHGDLFLQLSVFGDVIYG